MAASIGSVAPPDFNAMRASADVSYSPGVDSIALTIVPSSNPAIFIFRTAALLSLFSVCPAAAMARVRQTVITKSRCVKFDINLLRVNRNWQSNAVQTAHQLMTRHEDEPDRRFSELSTIRLPVRVASLGQGHEIPRL